ncbi:MAG: IS3 family transposase, partial [Bacillota bacterium]|nr:IS3 family transposase [Bacillota bacterium]
RLKNELFYGRSWTGVSLEEFMGRLDSYLRWYNEERIKMSLGGKSPIEYRQALGYA